MFRLTRFAAVLLLFFTLPARAQPLEREDWPALKVLVTRYYQFYLGLRDSVPPDREGFLELFAPGPLELTNDYCKGTVRFPSPGEYYTDITSFLNNNGSLVKNLGVYLSPLDKVVYARDKGYRYFIWLYKRFEYTRDRTQQHFWQRQRLVVQYMGRELGYRIAAVDEVHDIPSDLDGDQVADSWDQCPGTAPGARVSLNGCPITFGRVSGRQSGAEDPALSAGPGAGRADGRTQAAPKKWHWKNTNDGWIRVQY